MYTSIYTLHASSQALLYLPIERERLSTPAGLAGLRDALARREGRLEVSGGPTSAPLLEGAQRSQGTTGAGWR